MQANQNTTQAMADLKSFDRSSAPADSDLSGPNSIQSIVALLCVCFGAFGWIGVILSLETYHPNERIAIGNPLTAAWNASILIFRGGICVMASVAGLLLGRAKVSRRSRRIYIATLIISIVGLVLGVLIVGWRIYVAKQVFNDPYWRIG